MKRILLLSITAIVLIGTQCVAQRKISLADNSIVLSLPNDAQEVTKEKALSHLSTNSSKADVKAIQNNQAKKIYLINNTLLTLNVDDKAVNANHLQETKKGMDEIFKLNKSYKSYITDDGNKSILVMSYTVADKGYYNFISYNKKFNKAVGGKIEYPTSDNVVVANLLNQITTSLKFDN